MTIDDSYTKVLLHMDGADASTTFVDESGKTWTASGNAKLTTTSPKFGNSHLVLDGTGDYIYTADSSDFYFGSGNFTIDFWYKPAALPASGSTHAFFGQRADANNYVYLWLYNNAGTYSLGYQGKSGGTLLFNFGNTWSVSTGNYYHLAFVRIGSTWKIFSNGTNLGDNTEADEWPNIAAQLTIGAFLDASGNYINGNIDELRISKGIARWTDNFTPPSSAYAPIFGSPRIMIF